MEYLYNPIINKEPQGACKAGSEVTYTVKVSRWSHCEKLFVVLIDDSDKSVKKIKMPLYSSDEHYYTYQACIKYENVGLYWYYFEIQNPDNTFFLCKTQLFDVEPMANIGESFAQVIYKKQCSVTEDFRRGVVYHIFVDRFKKSGAAVPRRSMILRKDWGGSITKNSQDFLVINKECFGGDLQGVIEKLPYIASLGTKTIYLSPIFESSSYHKYDTADFLKVDSMFGGDKVFNELVKEARRHGINILLDGVFNHVGSDSVYFNKLDTYDDFGAYQSKKSKYFDWFTFDEYPEKYSSWWGIDTLPQFNESNSNLQKFITGADGVIAKHMGRGILGFRLDVVDEITDEFLDKICARIKGSRRDALILGEVWEDASTKVAYDKRRHYFSGNQLDSVMNYPLKNAVIDFVTHGNAEGLASVFYMLADHYPKNTRDNLMNFLGTHDSKRILTVLMESGKTTNVVELLKMASAIQYCSPGVATVFYGDEAGIKGGEAPFCRVCFPWGKENKDILNWYKKLGRLRAMPVFESGDCNVLFFHNGVFVFERTDAKKSVNNPEKMRVIVAANCGGEDFQLNLQNPMLDFETNKIVSQEILLKPNSFVILISGDTKVVGKVK